MASNKDKETNRAVLKSLGYSFDENNNVTRKVRLEDDDEEYYISVEALNAINNGTINTYRPKSDGEARAIRALAKPKPTLTPGSAGKLVGEALTKNLPKSSRVSPTAPYSHSAPSFLRLTSAEKNSIKNPTETREDKVRKLAEGTSLETLQKSAKEKRQYANLGTRAGWMAKAKNFVTGGSYSKSVAKANSRAKLYEDALKYKEQKQLDDYNKLKDSKYFGIFSKYDKNVDDDTYKYVNYSSVEGDKTKLREKLLKKDVTVIFSSDYEEEYKNTLYVHFMEDEERKTYNALYKINKEKAGEYLNLLTPELEKRREEYMDYAQTEYAKEHPWEAAGRSAFLTPFSVTQYAANVIDYLNGEQLDTSDVSMDIGRTKTNLQKGITENGGNISAFFKSLGLSMADSAVSMAVSIATLNPLIGMIIMGSNAASMETYRILKEGGTAEQALASGTSTGLIETITEALPMDKAFELAKTPAKGFKNIAKRIAKQASIEGTEEVIAEILNNISNSVIMGKDSDYNKYVNELVSNEYSEAEAKKKAFIDMYVWGTVKAAAGGMLSGAGFATMSTGIANTNPEQYMIDKMKPKQLPPTTEVKGTAEVKQTETKQKLPVSTEGGIKLPKKAKRGNIEIDSSAKENITAELNETVATAEAKNNLYNSILRRLISASERYGVDQGELLEVMPTEINNPQELKDISQKVNTLFENQANFKRKDLPGKRYLYNSDDVKAALYKLSWLADNYETADSTPAVENIPQNVVENSETVIESPADVISQPENVIEHNAPEVTEATSERNIPTYEEFRDAINRAYPDADESLIRQAYDEQFPTLNPNGEVKLEYINSVPEHLQRSVDAIKKRTGIDIVVGSRYVDGQLDPNFRGLFDGEKIIVSENATEKDVADAVVLHELTHSIEKTSQYQSIVDTVVKAKFKGDDAALQKSIDDKIAEYKGFGKDLSREDAKAEIIASSVKEYIFADDVQSIVNSNYTLAQKIYDIINELIYNLNQKYGGTLFNLDELKAAQRKYRMALEEYKKNNSDALNEMKQHSRKDTKYLNAVESGDMETAQRMVDEAAKKAGAVTDNSGNTKHNYHGTVDNFNSFEAEKSRRGTYGFGFYFANHKGLAQNFANYQSKKNDRPATIKDVYIMTNKFATRNDHKITAEQVSRFAQMYGLKLNKNTFGYTDSIEEWVSNANDSSILVALQEYVQKQSDYDTKTLLKDLSDVFGYDGIKDSDETVLWNNRLVKLADPVTYDDNGNVIPLSKRFDTKENEDTRYLFSAQDMEKAVSDFGKKHGQYLFERFKKPSLKNAVESFGKEYATNEMKQRSLEDTKYLKAVESGDMETAQRMVDEKAKETGFTPVRRYHQTGEKFSVFSNENPDAGLNDSDTPNGYFFKENDHDIGVGADFVKTGHGGSIQMAVYLKADNMLYFKNRDEAREWYSENVVGYRELLERYNAYMDEFNKISKENHDKMFDELVALDDSGESTPELELQIVEKYDKIIDDWIEDSKSYQEGLRARMRTLLNEYFIEGNSGYDGIELADDGHRYIDGKREDVHTFIVFKNTQIKSADPVTYDDNGDVIPLSKRFDTRENEDTRYLFSAQDMEKAVSDFGKKHGYTPKATEQQDVEEDISEFTDEEGVEYTRIDDIDDSFGVKILEGKTEYGQRKLKIDLNIPDYEGIYNSDEYKRIIENAGDIGNVKGTTLTAERAFEKAFGKLYKDFDKVVYENLDNSKLQYMAVLDYLRNDLENNVISRGIKKGSKDSALLQMYGEKVITLEELKGKTKNWRNIVEADIYMRSMYDALIDSINDTKKKIYPNIEAQETALHEELAETERKLDLIEQGELLGLLPISKGDKLQRARYLEKAIENMKKNSRNSMESIDNKISAVKEQLDGKKNKYTKAYAELSNRLSNLEAKRERLKDFFEMSEERKKEQLDGLLKEYGSADEMHEGIKQSLRDNLNDRRNDIVKKLGDELRWRGKRIPKRKDYYRHFQEVSNSILGELLSKKNGNISAELVLTSQYTKPKAKWESFAQRRRGTDTVYDAVGGYLDYIDAAAYAMSIDPNISVIRKLTDDLIYETSSSNKETYGTNNANATIQRLDALANELAGKTVSSVDRIVQDNIGRKNFKIVKKIIKLLKAASIVGNVGSAIVQVSNVPNAIGTLKNKATIIPALGDGLSELKNGNNNFYDALMNRTEAQNKSTFLRERYFDSKSKFDTGILANAEKLGNWMLSVGDEMSTRLSWNAFYREGKKLGVENPVRYADSKTRKAVGGRGLGEKSLVQQSATMTAALPFTLEVSNAWQVQKDLAREIKEDVSRQDVKGAMEGVGNFLTLYICNAVIATALGAIRGSDGGVFNPVGIIFENVWNEIFGSDEEDEENFFLKTGKEILGNFVSSLPAGQFAASFLDDDVREDIFGDEDPLRYGDSNLLGNMVNKGYHMLKDRDVDSAVDFASTVIPGGNQMRKSYNAAKILKNGGVYSDSGELKYPVERNAENYVKGLLFGKSAFDETKSYYDNEATPLTEEETREYEYRIKQGEKPQTVYDDIYQQKKERGKKTAESKAYYAEADKFIEPVDYEVRDQVNKAYDEYKKIDPDAYGIGFPEAQREFSYKVGNGKAKKYELTAEQYAELQNMYNKRYAEKIEKTLKAPMTTEKKYEALSKKRKEAIKEVKREFYYKHFGN